nr:urea transporter [Actinomadura sp. CNU-125]
MSTAFLTHVDGVMPRWSRWLESRPVLDFVDYGLRGVGQVVFMNNPVTGLLILVALWWTSAWLGFAALLGLVASTGTALALGFDRGAVRAGLFGFNGVLTGCGLAVFLAGEFRPGAVVYIVAAAAVSTVVTAALTRVLLPTLGVPGLTLPFNVVTLAFLLASFGFVTGDLDPAAVEPRLPAVGDEVDRALRGERGAVDGTADTAMALLGALLRGVAQVFLSGSAVAGVLIVAGMAVCSRVAAARRGRRLADRAAHRAGRRRRRPRRPPGTVGLQLRAVGRRDRGHVLRPHLVERDAGGGLRDGDRRRPPRGRDAARARRAPRLHTAVLPDHARLPAGGERRFPPAAGQGRAGHHTRTAPRTAFRRGVGQQGMNVPARVRPLQRTIGTR